MSEIRSISEGTFVIGDTNGLTFEAGPGISVSQPSEGTVRIANDETVLFETSSPTQILYSTDLKLNLSESPFNFERIKIYYKISFGNGIQVIEVVPTDTTNTFCVGGFWCSNSDGTAILNDSCCAKFLSDKLQLTYGSRYQVNRTDNTIGHREDRGPSVTKVVGINRISGGNNE